MNKKIIFFSLSGVVVTAIVVLFFVNANHSVQSNTISGTNKIQVVAAENFWGNLIFQLGGNRVSVTNIVSDPNADPHEYETNTNDARLFATANYVILNGAGYDSWGDNLLSANSNPNQKVLKVADLLGKKEGDNPHFWYNPSYVNEVIAKMETDLIAMDPANAAYYKIQYAKLQTALAPYQNRIVSIKQQFGGTKVACTEDIFIYLGQSTGLNLISPPAFIQAVGEGNDPSASSIVEFQTQLKNKEPKILVYNEQTVTPITESMKKIAADNDIPVVGITETIQPPDTYFQDWMNAELIGIENALNTQKLGQ